MDNKKDSSNPNKNNQIDWKSLGFFSAEDYLIYVFKKTEKITAALYLVSGLLKDEEPIKWELRDKGIDLLSSSFSISNSLPGDKNSVIQSLFNAALETLSLLNVAKISNLISDMNHRLLIQEIDKVITLLSSRLTKNVENAGYVLSESFFQTPDLFSSGFKSSNSRDYNNSQNFNKGQVNTVQGFNPNKNGSFEGQQGEYSSRDKRQDMIISLLNSQSHLTIKDFSKVIKDCSEKTIQRELIDLVNKGVIVKEGERRWSKYSLKNRS